MAGCLAIETVWADAHAIGEIRRILGPAAKLGKELPTPRDFLRRRVVYGAAV